MTSGNARISYASEEAKYLWDVSSEHARDPEILGRMVHPEFVEGLVESLKKSASMGSCWEQTWNITTPLKRVKWLKGRGYPGRQEGGSVLWNVIILDVSPLKEAEELLGKSESEARASSQVKTEFLNKMNHELRTPLNAIIGPLDLLDSNDSKEEQRSILDLM